MATVTSVEKLFIASFNSFAVNGSPFLQLVQVHQPLRGYPVLPEK